MAFQLVGNGCVKGLIVDVDRVDFDAKPAVARHRDLWPDFTFSLKFDCARFFTTGDFNGRGCDEINIMLLHGLREIRRDRISQRLFACWP